MKLTPDEKALVDLVPLMKCGNRMEFQHRLQWLSEGMLRNHMESVINYTVDQTEVEIYRKFKEGRLT